MKIMIRLEESIATRSLCLQITAERSQLVGLTFSVFLKANGTSCLLKFFGVPLEDLLGGC